MPPRAGGHRGATLTSVSPLPSPRAGIVTYGAARALALIRALTLAVPSPLSVYPDYYPREMQNTATPRGDRTQRRQRYQACCEGTRGAGNIVPSTG